MSESQFSDDTLAAYAEGILPEAEAAKLVSAAEDDPRLTERIELASRMLEEPVVAPLSPPAALTAWLQAEVAQAADEATGEPEELDVLEGGVNLAPVPVPESLTAWVRDAARQSAAPVEAAPVDAGEARPRGEVLAFSRRALALRVAAGVLIALGLGLVGGWTLRGSNAGELTAARDALRALESEAAQHARDLTTAKAATRSASGAREAAEAELRHVADRLTQTEAQRTEAGERAAKAEALLAAESAAFAQSQTRNAELARERDALHAERTALTQERDALAKRLTERPGAEALARATRDAQAAHAQADQAKAEAKRLKERGDALQGQVAALQAELNDELPSFAVAQAKGVERWANGRWEPVAQGATLVGGDVLRGGPQAALRVGRKAVRLRSALYQVRARGLEPLPNPQPALRRAPGSVLATQRAARQRGALRQMGATFLPFLR